MAAADATDPQSARLRYGHLAGEVGRALGWPKPKGRPSLTLLSEVIPPDKKGGEPRWRMHELQREVERSRSERAPHFHPPEYWEDYERASDFHRSWAARRVNELDLDVLLDFWNREG